MTRNRVVVAGLTLATVGTLGVFLPKHGSDGGPEAKTPPSPTEQVDARPLPTTGVTPPRSAAAGKTPAGPSDASDRSDASERPARVNRLPGPALRVGNPAGGGMAAEGALDPDGMKDRYTENEALDERIGVVGPDDQYERVRVVKTDMKYPLVRVVDRFRSSGALLSQTAMVADHVTLKVKEGTTEAQLAAYAQAQGGTILRKLRVPGPGTYLVKFDKVTVDTVPHAVAALSLPSAPVEYVNPDYVVYALDTTPNDPFFNRLWGMRNTGQIASTGTVVSAGDTIAGTAFTYSPVTSGVTGMLYYCGLGNPGEFPAAVSNNIALIQRGILTFAAKAANAKAAGATAVIIYNNASGPFSGTFAMPGDWPPSLSIASDGGATLLARTNTSVTVTIYGSKVGADISAPAAWDVSTGDTNLVVGVIDTGVDYNHPDLSANMWTNPGETPGNGMDDDGNGYIDDVHGYDFCNDDNDPMDDHFHGTHVAGTIGAAGNNEVGVAGVCWKVRIMPLKFLSAGGSGYQSDAIEAVYYGTANGAKLTSNSWGGGPFDQVLHDAIGNAGLSNILFVAAAGNSSGDNDANPTYPSSYDCSNIVAVAATDCNDLLASFSCYGANSVDVGAPGVNIYSTFPLQLTTAMNTSGFPTNYAAISGTSMATPHVAGACALLAAAHPELSAMQIKNLIMAQTDPIPALTGKCRTGGRLNIGKAIVLSSQPILRLWGQSFTDPSPGGNGDGRVNPGETALITVRLMNASTNLATAVTATIASPIAAIAIVSNTVAFGAVPGLTEIQAPIPFVFTVATDCPPQVVAFEMVTTDGAGHAWTNFLPVRVRGMARISGTIRADGAPAIGFRVDCTGKDVDTGAFISLTVYSDINGKYAFDVLDGNFTVTASWPGNIYYILGRRNIVTPPNATNVDFEATTVAISGRVTDAKTGNPLTNATVDYYVVGDAPDSTSPGVAPASWPTFGARGATTVDANGNYAFSAVMMTTSIVSVTPWVAGYSNVTPRTVIVPTNAAGVDFALSAPDVRIGIAPAVVARTVKIGQVVTQTLAIANSGGAGMPWTLWQESDEAYQAGAVVRSLGLKWNDTTDYFDLHGVAFDGSALNFNYNPSSPHPVYLHDPTTGAYLDQWDNEMNLGTASALGLDWDGVNFLLCDNYDIRFINPGTKLTVKSVRILEKDPNVSKGGVFGGGFLWILTQDANATGCGNKIVKADRRTGATLASVPAPTDLGGIEYFSGAIWCPDSTFKKICKVNPADGRVLRTFSTPATKICDLAKDRTGNLWALDDAGLSCRALLLKVGAAAWLSSSGTSGTVAAGGSNTVQLTFNSTTAGLGVHTAMVSVVTSDPDEPEKLVPVLFTVTASELPVLDAPASAEPNPVILPATASLRVAAHDPDGDPLVFTWSQVGGPGTTTFTPNGTAAASNSVAMFSRAGTYVLRVTASNGNANEIVTSDVTVRAAGIETDVASVTVPEGSNATFRARLVADPAASVTVTVARASGDTDITVAGESNLVFDSGNWADWQTVTLAAAPDADVLDGTAAIALSAGGLQAANVTATEREAGAILRVLAGTGGTVSPAGATNVLIGATVTVAATPASGRCFARWVCTEGSAAFGNALAPTTTVTVAAAATIRANFGPVSGTAWAWGCNQNGQLGDGTLIARYEPVMVKNAGGQPFTNVAAVALGWEHTVALLTDSNVWTWGINDWGQLGDDTPTRRTVPGKVSGVSNVVAVAAGAKHTVALDRDGAVWTWGWNRNGQLGDGTSGATNFRTVPWKVSGVSNVVAIACGVHHTMALKSDGSVWAWGYNWNGQLGDGTWTDRTTPVQVTGLSNVTSIVGSDFGGSALKGDGGVWTWGSGSGMPTSPLYVPQPVAISDVFALSAGSHTLALKNDGSLWGWGANYYGHLGNGVIEAFGTTVYPPVQSLMSNAAAFSAGNNCSLAIDGNGGVWSWGYNTSGQLGSGTNLTRATPAKIAGSCDYVVVQGGKGVFNTHCAAIRQSQTYIGVTTSVSSVSLPEGGTNTFQVKLSAQPGTDVTITVVRESGDNDILVTGGTNLTFTSANWNTYQTVTLAAAEDSDASNGAAVIWLAGADYDARVTAVEADNDAVLTVYAGAGGTVSPNGATVVTKGTTNLIAATPGAGHVFSSWSVRSGSPTIANTNAASTTVTITNAATVEANFTVIPTPTVLVSTNSLSVPEGGTAQFQVKLDAPPPFGLATVTVARASGDADIGVQSGASLVFDAGNWSAWQAVTLEAAKDGDSVNGTAAIQCAGDSIIPATVTATELDTDNPGEVRMQPASYVVNEAGGGVLLNVERVNGATGAASVRYATADGTAAAGSDYVATTGTLTWAADEMGAKSVVVPILDDLVAETAETFGFGLSDVTGAALATPTNATVTILANDGPVWANRLKIAFTGYNRSETLTNFPALVKLDTTISNFTFAKFLTTNGYDVRFWNDTETTNLNYEIEKWNTNGTSVLWVQVPVLTNNAHIWMTWGDSAATNQLPCTTNGAVWANYGIVLHFGDGATVSAYDSSPNRKTYTINGAVSAVAGKVSGAAAFNGSSGWIDLGTSSTWLISANKTVSFWLVNKGTDKIAYVYDRGRNADEWGQDGVVNLDGGRGIWVVRPSPSGVQAFTYATMQHGDYVSFAYSGGTVYCDRNGGQTTATLTSFGEPTGQPTYRAALGRAGDYSGYYFDGTLDEFRIATVARSTNWIWAEYLNMASNGVFQTYTASAGEPSLPAAPTGLTATAVATNRIELGWTDNAANETGYLIERSPDSNAWALVTVTTANATNVSDGGLTVDTLYHYRVAAANADGRSAWAFASARTLTVYGQWRRERFTPGELGNPGVSGDNADPDHDGMSNINEFYSGTEPRVTESVLAIEGAESVAGTNWFVIEWQSASNRLYDLHRFTNLVSGVTNVIATDLPATPPVNVYTDQNADAQMLFYRIKVK